MKFPAALRRADLAGIVQWSVGFVVLGLLMVSLLSLPFQLYAVRTGSMEPAFGRKDLVLVHKSEWQLGQPITFTHNGEVITHRLVSVNADGTFATKGDANKTPDPWVVQPRETIGAVVASVPKLGYWLVYLKSITGLASVICAVVGTRILWSIARELEDKPRENIDLTGADVVRIDAFDDALVLAHGAEDTTPQGGKRARSLRAGKM
jgi:signal peptidase I